MGMRIKHTTRVKYPSCSVCYRDQPSNAGNEPMFLVPAILTIKDKEFPKDWLVFCSTCWNNTLEQAGRKQLSTINLSSVFIDFNIYIYKDRKSSWGKITVKRE